MTEDDASEFASRVSRTIPSPSNPSRTVTIRKLARKQFREASRAHRKTIMQDMRDQFGENWHEVINKFKADEKVQKEAKDPLLQYDVDTLLQYGVTAWTLNLPLNEKNLADLDEDTAEGIAREVLRLTAPKLFESYEGEERKNDSSPSGDA